MRTAVSAEPAPAPAVLSTWPAVACAVLGALVLDLAFPRFALWPLAFVGVALILVALRGRRGSGALLVGFASGLMFYLTHIEWATLFLGPVPWAALSTLEALFFMLGGLAIALAYRWVPLLAGGWARFALVPVVVAGLWTAREAIASVWPYGGFAWGRVALSQTEGPFAQLFPWLGVSGVSFACVLLVALAVEAALRARSTDAVRGPAAGVAASALAVVLVAVPAFPISSTGELRVAAVQGNAKAGYFDQRELGDNLADQVSATLGEVETTEDVDVVVWPEGSSDLDPLANEYAARVFDSISREYDAPLVAGAVTQRDGLIYNSSLLWKAGEGMVDVYDKKHPIPFGEYVPDRAFWRPFAPDLIDLIGRDYTPGTTDTVFELAGTVAGINICFDISDDQVMTDSVREGAEVIFAQTNNADFGRTDESVQQLAIARARALELGRTVVNISTVGTSAVIAPDGTDLARLPWYTPEAMVLDVPLVNTTTPAVSGGRLVEWSVSGFGLAALLSGALVAFARRRS